MGPNQPLQLMAGRGGFTIINRQMVGFGVLDVFGKTPAAPELGSLEGSNMILWSKQVGGEITNGNF
ncbi:MAG: hypothetical protein AABY74_05355 [Planctomycetota bacterium]